ncbi:zinc-binding oxidoreductase [Fusarium sporotrichioides]|uniref:Zinc-binding oxidoreductase n=1 Tax=Fusarium sporotrichioides TaxID=5514 RepID=A0A395S3T2_FUSSP|nr:zinc-binding oxidoreductase [Fusarium sporotrichioides]
MKALRIVSPREAAVVDSATIPLLRENYILVKTKAVAVNPADWKFIDHFGGPGETIGYDYSGVVEKVGAQVENGLRPGDRVAGMVHGYNASNHEDGAFAEYITAKASLQLKIPDNMTFEAAATLGAGILTAGQGLYQSLALPLPENSQGAASILVYGGSTATGSLAIQFAKLSGFRVVSTASLRHEAWLRELGADYVFDYNSPTCAADIRQVTHGKLAHVFDTIGTAGTAQLCCDAIGTSRGIYSSLAPISTLPRLDVINKSTNVFTAFGEDVRFGDINIPTKTEDYKFAVKFIRLAQQLLSQGKLRNHPVSLEEGGLDAVLDGVNKLREGKVSGAKLVYKVDSVS